MIVLLIAGSIFGMSISGADVFNLATSKAEANRLDTETRHQQAIFEQTERLAEVQTNAQIEEIQSDQQVAKQQAQLSLDYEKQYNEIKLAAYKKFTQILGNLMWIFGIALSVGIVLALGLILIPRAISTLRNNNPQSITMDANTRISMLSAETWKSMDFRELMIKQARENEVAMRQAKINQQNIRPFYDPENVGHDNWNELPLAT
jgi:hypothetical protein